MRAGLNFTAAILAAVIAVLGTSIFTVDQRQYAIVFQLGEVREEISVGPVFQVAPYPECPLFRQAILTLDSAEPERYIPARKEERLGRFLR